MYWWSPHFPWNFSSLIDKWLLTVLCDFVAQHHITSVDHGYGSVCMLALVQTARLADQCTISNNYNVLCKAGAGNKIKVHVCYFIALGYDIMLWDMAVKRMLYFLISEAVTNIFLSTSYRLGILVFLPILSHYRQQKG